MRMNRNRNPLSRHRQGGIARLLASALALLLLMSALVACGASGSSDANNSPAIGDYDAGGMEGKPTEDVKVDLSTGDYERKIIRTVTMSCETKAYDDALTAIMSALTVHGGYVETSTTSGTGYSDDKYSARRATYTLRVPAESLDRFLEALRTDEGIRIVSQSSDSDEITATYYDTQTRLETLEAEKTSLTAMLEGFTDYQSISAMLEVQERLYDVIEEIETLKTKLNLYDSQVAFSTVHLTLQEVITYTQAVEPSFGKRLVNAFTESWTDFGEGCQDFAVWFVEAFPTLLVLGAIAAAVVLCIRRASKKKKQKQQLKSNDNPPKPNQT